MRRRKQPAVVALSCVCLLVMLGSCTAPEKAMTPSTPQTVRQPTVSPSPTQPPLRVGMTTNYPPMVFKDHGHITGLEADFAHGLGEELGRPITLVELAWERLIPALQAGQIDVIMSGMSITEARQRQVRFVQPYIRVGQMAIIRKSDQLILGAPSLLYRTHKRVGYEAGTTGETFVREKLPDAQAVPLPSPAVGLQMLRAGTIDVLIHDATTVWRVDSDEANTTLIGLFTPLTEEYLAWAVRQTDTDLYRDLNTILAGWRRTGHLQSLFRKWLSFPVR